MINECPRCASRMSRPLSSGRQICPNCGWSGTLVRSNVNHSSGTAKASGLSSIFQLIGACLRLVRRSATYVILSIKNKLTELTRGNSTGASGSSFMQGLTQRLTNLEQAIPDAPTAPSHPNQGWMTPDMAFRYLGGNPSNPNSVITSQDGRRSMSLIHFQSLKTPEEFARFGLEFSQARYEANQPWLRKLSAR